MAGNQKARRAFTLVELLVVISIIGILIALLLPAVQMAREAGRRAKCANHVRQLCVAMENYQTLHKMFPMNWGAGSGSSSGTKIIGHSWMTMILPQIEQRPIYEMVAFGKTLDFANNVKKKDNMLVATTPIPTFKCPSDTHDGTLDTQALASGVAFGVTNYKACAGSNWGSLGGSVFKYKKADAGFGGRNHNKYDGLDFGDGIICRGKGTSTNPVTGKPAAGKPITTANFQIRDGASNTFAVGEAVPGWCDWSAWYWYDGSTATCGIPLNYWRHADFLEKKPGTQPQYNSGDKANVYSFMSRHPDGANFGMCDSTVRFVNESIDLAVYRGLASIDGKEPVQPPD